MKISFAVLALVAAQEAGDLVGTKGVAGGTQYVNNRRSASQKRSPQKIWDGDHKSWFSHDGWEPTRSNHKWSAAKLEYTTSISKFCVAPRPEGARFARSRGPVELNGYSLFGALKKPTLHNGDERRVKLNQWTKLATIKGISGKTGSIRGPYKVQKNRRDIHGKECVEIPVTNTDQFNYVMIYHTTRAQAGNGDVLAVEVYAGAQPVPAEPIVLQVGGANDDGVKDHEDDFFNQKTLSPTKQPTVGFEGHKGSLQWYLAESNESCDRYCARKGSSCSQAAIDSIDTTSKIHAAFAAAGFQCKISDTGCETRYGGRHCPRWGSPYLYWQSNYVNQGRCFFGRPNRPGQGHAKCEQTAVDRNHRRLCPCGGGAEARGNLDAQIDQTDRVHQPTARPTAFPTKDQASAMGSVCKFNEGSISFTKPVGWVGAGPAQYYCNVWKCEQSETSFTFKKAMKKCSVEQYGTNFCSHTTCQAVQTNTELKRSVVGFYTFDNQNNFVNHVNEENFKTKVARFVQSTSTHGYGDNWGSWYSSIYRRYYGTWTHETKILELETQGTCKIERFNGNMAWHVSGNTGAAGKSPCSITTRNIIMPEPWMHQCKFALTVHDVDYEYSQKESDDQICFEVLDHNKHPILKSKTCQTDDVRRRLAYRSLDNAQYSSYYNNLGTCGIYGCIGWYGYRGITREYTYSYTMKTHTYGKSHRAKVIQSDWIPQSNFEAGFYVKISAKTNMVQEHWYADDLVITCREMRQVVQVTSDHKETKGGRHTCGFSKHTDARSAGRPACDCICHGARKQDADGFERSLNEISKDFDVAIAESKALPAQVVYKFNFNDRGDFTGHMQHVFAQITLVRSWYWYWKIEAVGTCAIERFLDITTSLSLQLGSDMAWHVQNNGAECQMQTKNAWSPLKPDDYHMCKFTLDVYDLDEYRRETRYYRTIGCYGSGWRRRCYWQYRAYTALYYTNKEADDYVCFQVVDQAGAAVTKKICHNDDAQSSNRYLSVKRIESEYVSIPTGGVNVKFFAKSNDKNEHWYADDMRIACKLSNRVVANAHDATSDYSVQDSEFNKNNFYSQHTNLNYNENDHTYTGQRVAHFHKDS